MEFRRTAALFCLTALAVGLHAQEESQPGEWGHSHLGSAYDTGMRTRPWKMEGIGNAPFPITTNVPEVQEWFNQGNALLHSFWFEEAERSFRWCAKLDPECAMAYLGMARTGINWFNTSGGGKDGERCKEFLRKAVELKWKCTDRERMYIEAYENAYLTPDVRNRQGRLMDGLRGIIAQHPDDIEARAILGMYMIRGNPGTETDQMLRDVFAANPDHPGAHHYTIHAWDTREPINALVSCQRYGDAVPNIGHANHMPGHVYSKIGMWKEAARSMDAATRVELRYMQERMALPFETWNFAHNRNYLCFIQEHLGQADAAIQGAWDLIRAPMDPDYNSDNHYEAQQQGMIALARALVRFERWDEILSGTGFPEREVKRYEDIVQYAQVHAHIGKGDLATAQTLYEEFKKGAGRSNAAKLQYLEMEGKLAAARGDAAGASSAFEEALKLERQLRKNGSYTNDPPNMPYPIAVQVGHYRLSQKNPRSALEAYREALEQLPGCAAAYAGLAQAYAMLGMKDDARAEYGKALYVLAEADEDIPDLVRLKELGLEAPPVADVPAPERPYTQTTLEHLGPLNWSPFIAPELRALNSQGQTVDLRDYRGKNVILVFYLSDECVHCMEQLQAISAKQAELDAQNTVVLAISSATPQANADSMELGKLPFTLLSDTPDHQNARRYASYDDFEEMELHSTILIDAEGRIHWKRTGGDPFMNVDFLIDELKRIRTAAASRT